MSLNTAHANGGVLIFNGELILLYCDGVEMHFEGADAKLFQGSKKGRLYLTTHRMIFVNKNEKEFLQSFSFPFFSLNSIELEQPIFGANFIKGQVKAQQGGNWTGQAQFKLKFNSGGAIDYGQAMLQAAKLTSRFMPAEPPPYMPAPGPYYAAPPPSYMPPAGAYYGFTPPTNVFPDAPPPNSVFMTDAPPPYPGLNSGYTFNGATNGPPGGMKSQEAGVMPPSAYFNPNQPGYAYMPPPPAYQQQDQHQMSAANFPPLPGAGATAADNQYPPYPGGPMSSFPGGQIPSYPGGQMPPYPGGNVPPYPGGQAPSYPSGQMPPYPDQHQGGNMFPPVPPTYSEAIKKSN